MNPFNLSKKTKEKVMEEKKKRIAEAMSHFLDMVGDMGLSSSEMSDVLLNLTIQYQKTLLDEIDNLKKNERNIEGKITAVSPGRITL